MRCIYKTRQIDRSLLCRWFSFTSAAVSLVFCSKLVHKCCKVSKEVQPSFVV